METPRHGMNYMFDFDLPSKSKVKTYTGSLKTNWWRLHLGSVQGNFG